MELDNTDGLKKHSDGAAELEKKSDEIISCLDAVDRV